MRKNLFSSTLLLAIGSILNLNNAAAQVSANISGTISNSSNQPIEHVSVLILRSKDSVSIAGTVSNNEGRYNFKGVAAGHYLLLFSRLGYEKLYSGMFTVSASDKAYVMDPVVLHQTAADLGEVVVQSRKPLVQMEDDKLIFNVGSDPDLEGKMATDALRKTPFVVIDGDGNISMAGKKSLKILLNGKSTGLIAFSPKDILKTFPANLIKRIEVIMNPSAKYDAEGTGGVINIITKRGIQGYRVTAGGSMRSNFDGYNGPFWFTNFAIKYGRFGISGYWGSNWNNIAEARSLVNYQSKLPGSAFDRRITEGMNDKKTLDHQGDFELSWDLDSLSSLSGYGTVRTYLQKANNNKHIQLYDKMNTVLDEGYWKDSSKDTRDRNSWGLDFTKKFKRNKNAEFGLNWNLQQSASVYISNNDQDNLNIADRFIINDNQFKNTQHTIQSDLVWPMANKQSLEVGIKGIFRDAYSNYVSSLKDPVTQVYQPDPTNTNQYNFKQQVWGVYTSYRFSLGTFRVMPGFRIEQTSINARFQSAGTAAKQDYTSLFPNISIRKNLAKNNQSIGINYTRRLARPDISYLNPFVKNSDPLFIIYGNPQLNPEFGNEFSFSYNYNKSKFSFNTTLSHDIVSNEILAYTSFNPTTGISQTTYDNLGSTQKTSMSVFISIRLSDKLSFNTPMDVYYVRIKNNTLSNVTNRGWGASGNINVFYRMGKNWDLSYNSSLQIPNIQLQTRQRGYYYYTFNLSKKVFNKHGTFTLGLSNPFGKNINYQSTLESSSFVQLSNDIQPVRRLSVGFYFSVSKLKENISRKKGVRTDDVKTLN